jgi:hypothetical protein
VKTDTKVVEKKVEVVAVPAKTVEVSMSCWALCGDSMLGWVQNFGWVGVWVCRADVLGAMQSTVLLSARDTMSVLLLSGMADYSVFSVFCAQLPCGSRLL